MVEEPDVVLTNKKYNELLDELSFLEALRCCGVDNWQGYDDACSLYQDWKSEKYEQYD